MLSEYFDDIEFYLKIYIREKWIVTSKYKAIQIFTINPIQILMRKRYI